MGVKKGDKVFFSLEGGFLWCFTYYNCYTVDFSFASWWFGGFCLAMFMGVVRRELHKMTQAAWCRDSFGKKPG